MTAETGDQDTFDDAYDRPPEGEQVRRSPALRLQPLWHFTIDTSESRPIYLPSIEDIQQECDLIKREWTQKERRRRARADWHPVDWTVPNHVNVEQPPEPYDE